MTVPTETTGGEEQGTAIPALLSAASPDELRRLEALAVRELALLSPLDYAIHTSQGRVKAHRHTELLSRYCKAVVEHALYEDGIGPPARWLPDPDDPTGEEGRWAHPETGEEPHNILVISAPPQHGKSLIVTETVPAWFLTLHPDRNAIVTGYEADFAKGFGRANRNKIEEHPELGISVSRNTRAADEWEIDGHGGGLVTAGAGGAITGRRGDLILIDDPVKNSEEALSEAKRRNNKNWWQSTIKSRVRTSTVVIIIQTRWHEDDLAGHVTDTERCFTLNLPALAFEATDPETGISVDPDDGTPDPLGRKPGEALCPALQTRAMLLAKQQTGDGGDEPGGMLWFSALYQGKPNIEGGGILAKPYRYFQQHTNQSGKPYFRTRHGDGTHHESFLNECIWFVTSDLAVSTKSYADYTVFALFAWTPHGELLLADMERGRIESTGHVDAAERFWRKAKQRAAGAGVRFFGVEKATYGISLMQHLRKAARIPVKELSPDKDKTARAMPVGIMMQNDELFLPEGHDLLEELEREMQSFPNGKHDDMVDCLSYAVAEALILPKSRYRAEGQSREERHFARRKAGRRTVLPVVGRL